MLHVLCSRTDLSTQRKARGIEQTGGSCPSPFTMSLAAIVVVFVSLVTVVETVTE